MDSLITAAAHALVAGDPLLALKRVALRDDAPALALRGIAMAQLGDLGLARELLRRSARAFGPGNAVARARCAVAEAEIALVSRDLTWPTKALDAARILLEQRGDHVNAAHAGCLAARRMLLVGRLDEAERVLSQVDPTPLSPAVRATYELATAGIAIRRVQTKTARSALDRADQAARIAGISSLTAEVENVSNVLTQPVARLIAGGESRIVVLEEVEALLASETLIIDACRNMVREQSISISLATRPVLFALARGLAEAWPGDASRESLIRGAFRAKQADESHRARLRVELARLRVQLRAVADVRATARGFALSPHAARETVVLTPPAEEQHGEILALLADGEAWSSAALAIALSISPRTVQRALEHLSEAGKVHSFGRARARRWMIPPVPGFPTTLLLPGSLPRV